MLSQDFDSTLVGVKVIFGLSLSVKGFLGDRETDSDKIMVSEYHLYLSH